MTPLATKVARNLTLPIKQRAFDDTAAVLDLFDQEMHCFEVSAISKAVNDAMDQDNLWPEIESMLPGMFLPSPVTWLEQTFAGNRIACVIRQVGDYFSLSTVHESPHGPFSLNICDFRLRSLLEPGERIDVKANGPHQLNDGSVPEFSASKLLKDLDPTKATREQVRCVLLAKDLLESRMGVINRELEMAQAGLDVVAAAKRFIGMSVLTIDLLNTPGLVGLKQREANRKLARDLRRIGVGRYPLQAWSEVVLKHETSIAGPEERVSGTTHHKCLHFVRSHRRHYRDGHVTVIPAHWRGDPALGIKRTRYRLAA